MIRQTDLANFSWPNSIAAAKTLQLQLRDAVIINDPSCMPEFKTVAGVDVAFRENGAVTFAAVVVMRFPECEILEQVTAQVPTNFPYVPGYLSFRELPAILEAWRKLSLQPDFMMCDGQGIAHPRKFGLACHLGLVLDLPSVGVAKNRLVGEALEPGIAKGQKQPLDYNGEQVGWVLRSRKGVKPLFVSPGHKMAMATSVNLVESCCLKYRLPEPTRIADKLSKTRT